MLNVGAIGDRNHAARMIDLVEATGLGRIKTVFHPRRLPEHPGGTSQLSDLLDCDAILILSPNASHAGYLTYLAEHFSGPVLCEKPPVATSEELERIERLDKRRFFFNFNLRFSRLYDCARRAIDQGQLGQVLHAQVWVTHGLAFKKEYADSWRADGKRHRHGVLETVAIHYVDLLSLLMGPVVGWDYTPRLVAGQGTAYDTCHLLTRHAAGGISSIFASYAAPLTSRFALIGTDGVLLDENGHIELRCPRNTFDANGYFAPPAVREAVEIDGTSAYRESLLRSLTYFLEHCRDHTPLPPELFDASVAANRLVISV